MLYVTLVLLTILNGIWLVSGLFCLPGNWLMILTTLVALWGLREHDLFSVRMIVAVVLLALAGELIEFFAGFGGAKKVGAGRLGSLAAIGGALVGAVVGTGFLPVIGTLLGGCIGAGLATWGVERLSGRQPDEAMRSGVGAGRGTLIGTLTKFLLGCLIWLIIAVAAFWN
jgi:uncharacterized protein YqgC (DUF456 family)